MPKERLTEAKIAGFKVKKETYFRDTETHLAVRVRPTGSKVFQFVSTLNYKDIRITIGEVGAKPLHEAKKQAQEWQEFVDRGIDPRQAIKDEQERIEAERQDELVRNAAQQKIDAIQAVTVGEAWSHYIAARMPKWGKRHLANHASMVKPGGEPRGRGRRRGEGDKTLPGPVYPLLSLRLADLTANAVHDWLVPLADRTPTQAAQCYRALRAFVAWCAEHPEYGPVTNASACASGKVRESVPTVKPKRDSLQREQLSLWFGAVRQIGNPVISAYLQALLLTGARREELCELTWEDVDFRWNSMTIRDKVDGLRVIPLTPYVKSLLAPLPRRTRNGEDGDSESIPFVFSSPTAKSGKLQEPRIQHVKALTVAGLPHVSIHGLRRSFGSLSEWCEVPVGIVAQIQGHKPSATAEKHYRVRPLDLLRMWHTKIEGWILNQAGIEQPTEDAQPLRVVSSNTAA